MSYTLGSHSLGTVTSEEVNKDAQLFQTPIPRRASNQVISLDLFGASRTIQIQGIWTANDGTSVATFITWLDGLVSGTQNPIVYASDTSATTYNVVIQTTNWKREGGEVNLINYTISMLECQNITI